jgi:hypothetical protein
LSCSLCLVEVWLWDPLSACCLAAPDKSGSFQSDLFSTVSAKKIPTPRGARNNKAERPLLERVQHVSALTTDMSWQEESLVPARLDGTLFCAHIHWMLLVSFWGGKNTARRHAVSYWCLSSSLIHIHSFQAGLHSSSLVCVCVVGFQRPHLVLVTDRDIQSIFTKSHGSVPPRGAKA